MSTPTRDTPFDRLDAAVEEAVEPLAGGGGSAWRRSLFAEDLAALLDQRPAQLAPERAAPSAPAVGELLALVDQQPVVRHARQDKALKARSTIDLHGRHVGAHVLLLFEDGDPQRPIVIGVLREPTGWPLETQPAGQVEVDADGARLIVQAGEQLVLRCGKASITLTKAGKVLIEGSYVLSRSTGVNRIKGGSVQLN